MQKIMQIMMSSHLMDKKSKELLLSYKIHLKDDSKKDYVNFCIKCFNGHLCVQYHNKKGWGLKCDSCNFRISML
jgi:hypothetical protein